MDINLPGITPEAAESLRKQVTSAEIERDFYKTIYEESVQLLSPIASGQPLSGVLKHIRGKVCEIFKHADCFFLEADKDCLNWSLVSSNVSLPEKIVTAQKALLSVPQALITFAASPSCPIRHDYALANSTNWGAWQSFLVEKSYGAASLLSVSDQQGKIQVLLVLQKSDKIIPEKLAQGACQAFEAWLNAAISRDQASTLLLEGSHKNLVTGFLNRFSFESNFELVLKDCRRHFQRVSILVVKLLTTRAIDSAELKELAGVIRETVRDNDLIAHFEEQELAIGIRIQSMDDSEVVTKKLLGSLKEPQFAGNQLIQDGVAIGIAFYPEYSSVEELYHAASKAAASLGNNTGYRIDLHGQLLASSDEFYR
ncbi:diguanylate cyclase domain-containing protein [Marinomonas epiphytica]